MKLVAAAFIGTGLCACSVPQMHNRTVPSTSTARLGESVRAGSVVVTPVSVVEDSRCPKSVQCIQAGTVRLLARIRKDGRVSETVAGLRQPADIGVGWLHLVRACPYPGQPGRIPARAYRFTLAIDEDAASDREPGECAAG
jgi:hypothetical protein